MFGKCSIAKVGTTTFENVVSGTVSIGGSTEEHFYNSPYPVITVGNLDVTFTIVTTDDAAIGYVQSQKVADTEITFAGVGTGIDFSGVGSTLSLTSSGDTLLYSLSSGYIAEIIEPNADNSTKSPGQYTVVVKACISDAGDEPIVTKTFTAGA